MERDLLEKTGMRNRLLDGLGAGLAATLIMTGLAFAVPAFGNPPLPHELTRAMQALVDHPLWLAVALAAHLSYGGLAGALYFGGAARVTIGGGALFGLSLWGMAVSLYAPLFGLGFVASHRPELALWSLPVHLIYGMALGLFVRRGEILQPITFGEPIKT
jgi:hypothetical protein